MIAATAVLVLGLGAAAAIQALETREAQPIHGPVVVELFTSEGCSSCPPADHVLSDLVAGKGPAGIEVIPLAWHVDYWDRLGWKDPWSSSDASERQRRYGSVMGLRSIYTPQMIVNGRDEFVGSSRSKAYASIRSGGGIAAVEIASLDAGVQFSFESGINPEDLAAYVAVTQNGLKSEVLRGENRGRLLEHDAVVVNSAKGTLSSIGSGKLSGTARIDVDRSVPGHLVVLIHDSRTAEIVAAGRVAIGSRKSG